ncbi:MAG TPA: ABC transporter permease [Ktedonobacterales bacterium]|nr:ABC transporter permease [Ktedonobacterales bacterium]
MRAREPVQAQSRAETHVSLQGREKQPFLLTSARGQALLRQIPLALASLPMLAFFALPIVALVLRVSPGALLANLVDPTVAQAINLSLTTTLITTGLTVLAGTPIAYLLARHRFPGRILIDTLIDVPMLLPPAVAGIALLVAFGRRGLLGPYLDNANIEIAFSTIAVVMAQIFVAGPFYIKTAITAFARVDREVEQAAAVDGANAFNIFRLITLPLCWSTLFTGAVMTWARALGEFGATILFAGNFPGVTQTMPLAIYVGFETDLQGALTLSVILLLIAFLVLAVVKGILRQRMSPIL